MRTQIQTKTCALIFLVWFFASSTNGSHAVGVTQADDKKSDAQLVSPKTQSSKAGTSKSRSASNRKNDGKRSDGRKKQTTQLPSAVVIEFVKEHHPELEALLKSLESKRPDRHRMAIKGLSRSVQRVKSLETSDPEKYQSALAQWKINSRINLVAIQMGLEKRPELESQLQKLIEQRVDQRKNQLLTEAKRIRKRLDAVEKQLANHEKKRQQEIDRQLKSAAELSSKIRNRGRKRSKVQTPSKADPKQESTEKPGAKD